jgi:hypothetical protein
MIRLAYPAGRHTSHTGDAGYLRAAGRSQFAGGSAFNDVRGYPILRAGSIVGITCEVEVTSYVDSGTLTIEARQATITPGGDTLRFSATSPTIMATGKYSWDGEQAEGVDTTVADDVWVLYLKKNSGTFTYEGIFATMIFVHDEP